ncbi:MAG: hypothetical protein ABWY56_01965 [Propionibacteriaceae bacterium]
MSAITSMLVPLETLAGWPEVANPNPLHVLGLLFGLPLVVIIVVWVLVKARSLSLASHESEDKYTNPTCIGSKEKNDEVLGSDNAAGQAALQGGPDESGSSTSDDRGGASARW